MATISNVTLSITNYNAAAKTVQLTFRYRLTPSAVEKMAGTVYTEQFALLGRDYLIMLPEVDIERAGAIVPPLDTVIRSFGGTMYAASVGAASIDRQLTVTVPKSILNEDPELSASGSEVSDEVLSRVTVTAVANLPVGAGPIPPGFSPIVSGTWK